MTKTQKFQFFTDPGHGWLRVPLEVIDALGVRPSSFSYRNGSYAYLEEDCDEVLFAAAWVSAHGCLPNVVEREPNRGDSHIRKYKHFAGFGYSQEWVAKAHEIVREAVAARGGAQ
jgi:hypothetical protein